MTAPMPKDLDIAAQIPVLSGLKPVSLAVLMTAANLVNLRPGQALFRQGEPATSFSIIVDGWVTCGRRPGKNFLTFLQHWSGAVTCPAC